MGIVSGYEPQEGMREMDTRELAETMADRVNAYGEALAADYDYNGYSATVTITDHGKRIATVEIDSDGDYELTSSRRRGLIARIVEGR